MKKIVFTLFVLMVSSIVIAQENESIRDDAMRSLNPPELVLGGPNGEGNGVVGAIPATVDISALGGATYTIPIQVPEGINGMQPNLSIVYNSQSGNGLLGWGWNLGGISAITREGPKMFHDFATLPVDFEHDRFALDGQRLMAISGKYGCDQTEYKTEVDGLNKIVSHHDANETTNGPAWFEVRTAEGLIMEYGRTWDSRICLQQSNDVCIWLLNKVKDRNDNYIEYHYIRGGASYALSYIKYTGRPDYSPCYTVYFDYESREDEEKNFIGNNTIDLRHLLTSIRLVWWDKELERYDFEYDAESGHIETLKPYNRLKKITYSNGYENQVSYNPTVINWGDYSSELVYDSDRSIPSGVKLVGVFDANGVSYSELNNTVKIPGDFNGDGYTDFIYVEEPNDEGYKEFHWCLNRGMEVNSFGDAEMRFEDIMRLNLRINWIYVCDFTGDGKDDFFFVVPIDGYYKMYAFKSCMSIDGTISFNPVNIVGSVGNNQNQFFYNVHRFYKLLVGDFIGIGKQEIIFVNEFETLRVYYDGGNLTYSEIGRISPRGEFKTGDFDGDGCTEIWHADNNQNGEIIKYYGVNYEKVIVDDYFLYYDHKVFLGDFNGDGHTDFLVYKPEKKSWEIYFYKANKISYPIYNVTGFLEAFGDPGYHGQNIDELIKANRFLEIADLDGDGKSDIIIRYGQHFHIFYGSLRVIGLTCHFAHFEDFSDSNVGIGGGIKDYSLCIGNFMGRGNQSILGGTKIFSKFPHTSHYNVESIEDGMGNVTAFEYDYLMPNIINPNEGNFYTFNSDDNLSPSPIAASTSIPLPIKALKKVSSYNEFSTAPIKSTSYQFKNALVNKTGRGFLGFAEITANSYMNEDYQGKITRRFSAEPMWQFCSLVPIEECTYNKFGAVISKAEYDYTKRWIPSKKVFVPLVENVRQYKYDVEGNFISKSITENLYETDLNSYYYYNRIVRKTDETIGTDANIGIQSVNYCDFFTTCHTEYYPENTENISNWVINRPSFISSEKRWRSIPNSIIRSQINYVYEANNPFLPSKVTTYPGGDVENTNGLATCVSYNYDLAGNVVDEKLTTLDESLNEVYKHFDYHDNYRYPILERNQLGYESQTVYNSEYGELVKTIDYNGLVTSYWRNDHLGSTDWSKTPDNVYSCVAKRWARINTELVADAPDGAAYYIWSKRSGGYPTKVFYDASGRELRTVREGINGEHIYSDTQYDDFGRTWIIMEPYFEGTTDPLLFTEYHYDNYNRLFKTEFPDGSSNTTSWNVSQNRIYTINEFRGANEQIQSTKTATNIVGWTIENTDSGGQSVHFNYYADGKLMKAGLNPDLEITIKYDDAGNRTEINDPDYGRVVNHYNAYGELEYTITPKGDRTIFEYDDLRRQVVRKEVYDGGNSIDITHWNYSDDAPIIGLLESIDFNNGLQTVEYVYDNKSRVETVVEKRGVKDFKTTYHYDDNSGRVDYITYPTGFSIGKVYDNGHLRDITDMRGNVLWHTDSKNAFGQITHYSLGNGIEGSMDYYPETHQLETQYATLNGNKVQDFYYIYDDFSNLASRTERKYAEPMTESFGYDDFNRLRTIVLNGINSGAWYDEYGRIGAKTTEGETVFYEADYDNRNRPHAIRGAEINNNAFPRVQTFDIEYTMFDKVKTIEQDRDYLSIDYGYDHQRIALRQNLYLGDVISKDYVGNCEYIDGPDGARMLTYLSGPMGVFAVYEQFGDPNSNDNRMHYLLKDHLGSITTITNQDGQIEQELSFDAWGNLRNPYTWTGAFEGKPMFDRGFTGHEHHYAFGLINMNGRMYDPLMSSFLSVDNYVQCPESSQSFNRYAYCMNNPLKYTDPDGEYWHLIIGAAVGGTINVLTNLKSINGDFGKGVAYFGIGALAGALSAGVGSGISSVLWEGSFSAGFFGTAAARTALTSFETGSIIGAASGFTGGFVTCSGNAWMAGDSFSKGLGKGFLGGLVGGASGYVLGGLSGGWDAVRHHRDFYSGDILSAQEKLDVLVGVNLPDLESLGDADAQLYSAKNLVSDNGTPDYGKCVPGKIDRIDGESGLPGDFTIIHRNNKIYIRNDRIEQAWNGNREALETIGHEWIHGVQYRSGEYGELLKANNNNFRVVADLLEYRAYQINYSRTGSSRFFERMLYYGFEKHSLFDSFMIRNGLSPLYHPY